MWETILVLLRVRVDESWTGVIGLVAIAAGIFSVLGGVFNWEFFFKSRKAVLPLLLFGRKGARIFYVLLGCFIVGLGVHFVVSHYGAA